MKNRKNNWIKIVIQLLSFILIPELFVTGFTAIGDIFSQIYAGSISWESVRYSVYVLIATVPGSVLVGRFFCGFFCSFGAVQDFLWFAARKLGKGSWRRNRNPEIYKKADRVLKLAKYGVLVYFVIFIWSGVLTWKKQGPWEIFGQYIVPGHWPGVKPLCSVGGILLLVILTGSVLVKRFFCRYFCPMGAVYALISRGAFLKIEKLGRECSACSLCTAKCSMGIDFTKKEQVTGGECIACQQCISWCPKGNAHFGIKYGMVIGVLLTCVMIGASRLLTARSYTKDRNIAGGVVEGFRYKDGTYTGTGEGYRGAMRVTVSVADGKIISLTLDSYEDDKSYMEKAKAEIFSAIIGQQNTNADTVSGATYSSKGLIQAVKNALEEAKRVTNGETDTDDDNNVVQLNTEEVEKAIDAVNELNGSDYTSASWAVVKVRLKDARKVLKNATEQAQLDEAAAQLNQAVQELQISDGTNDDPEPDLPPESTYIDGVYPVTVLCLPDADMDFEAYNLFAQVTIQDDKIIKIDNVYGDGGSGNDSYINKAVNGTSSKTGVVKQITEKGNLDGIDTVSRATCTSQAIIDACQQALNNAKRQ